jgi:hypothetical protein
MTVTRRRLKSEKSTLRCVMPRRKHGMLRIIDESGEDYLYPKFFFARLRSLKR